MSNIWEVLSAPVTVPQWFFVVFVWASVAVSLLVLFLAQHLLDKRSLSRAGKPAVAANLAADKKPDKRTGWRTTQSTSDAVRPVLSAGQRQELAHRVELGGGFVLADTGALLGLTIDRVIKLLRKGELASYRDQNDRTWVTAQSLANFIGASGLDGGPAQDPGSVAPKLERPRTSAPAPVPASGSRNRSLPFRQHYWYRVDGGTEKYATLAEALHAVGYKGKIDQWLKLPAEVRERIQREKV